VTVVPSSAARSFSACRRSDGMRMLSGTLGTCSGS
jgi:hypothetical protein